MSITNIAVYQVPVWALGYIVNGDTDNLTDEDIEMVDEFLEGLGGNGVLNCMTDEDAYFCPYPEFGKACNVIDAEYHL